MNVNSSMLVCDTEIENIPNYGILIKNDITRDVIFKEFVTIEKEKLIEIGNYYSLGCVVCEGISSSFFVIITRIV